MKQILTVFSLALLTACGGSGSTESAKSDSSSVAATTAGQPASAGGNFYDVSKWKTLDLKEFNIPFSISVPAEATANKSMNNDKGAQVQFGSKFMFYEIAPSDSYTTVEEVIAERKNSVPSSVTNFKIEKEDPAGFIYSYTEDGKTCRAFVAAKKVGDKVYTVELSGSFFNPAPEEIEKLYTGAKGS